MLEIIKTNFKDLEVNNNDNDVEKSEDVEEINIGEIEEIGQNEVQEVGQPEEKEI